MGGSGGVTVKALITVSYTIVTPESAEEGDCSERGWEDETGTEYTFSEAVKLLGGMHPSSSEYHPGVWYHSEGDTDYRTGETKELAYHVKADERFQRRLYQAVTGKR